MDLIFPGPQMVPMNTKNWESQMKEVANIWSYPSMSPSYVCYIVGIQTLVNFLFKSKMET